jgi:predicted type IV restriction endonuclease
MREALQAYVQRVGELAEHVRGNEQATKQSLVGPLFIILGDDLTDPRECIPEDRSISGPTARSRHALRPESISAHGRSRSAVRSS